MENRNFNKITIGLVAFFFCNLASATTTSGVGGGTITFSGAVTDVTCNVTTNNGSDFTVDMSPVTATDVGSTIGVVTANPQQFSLTVDGCTGFDSTSTTAQALKITFSGSNVSDDGIYLKNLSGTATGVGIGITSDGSSLVALNSALNTGLATTSSDSSKYDTAANGTLSYYANYYNYGGSSATTGSVITTATYTFEYE
ncbi:MULTISPECIES: fimbrial protein [Gibbsiella]|uniref:Fimbrial protein n=1 Tax=Gibbsiella dentisursi TaxID=796890 RepID=A0ABP7KLL9_9GAMM|nr:fimbrial protein [Gibbsiella quercinecans]